MDAPHPQSKPPTYNRGIVKQVLSGDAVVVRRAKAIGGPPPERQINFSNVIAPKVARRATASQAESKDEPFGWEAREFLRKKVIGKEVFFAIETSTSTGREYGTIFTGTDPARDLQSLTELMVAEGLLTVRRESIRGGESKLTALEDAAKAAGKGKWGSSAPSQVRNVKWVLDNPRSLLEKFSGKPKKAIIEHVRDGSTVRAFLLPEYNYITLMVSGIRCPMFKVDSDGRPDKYNAEPHAEEARYFVESRLLQRDVQIILESANNNNLVGSIKHPNGNIAELLLREGFAKCVDWSLATVTGGPEKLRKAERSAKQNQLKLWVDYKQPENQMGSKDNSINGKVLEIVNGDALVVRENNGKVRKIFLSSIRPPRSQDQENSSGTRQTGKNFRPLYDIPWLFEAREFLRKKLIGQKIKAVIDYVQPAQNNFPEKICCTVKIADLNVATAMVSKGYATVVKYRQDDDQRSSCYDDLLAAEAKAIKEAKGLHSKKDIPVHRVIDLSGDSVKAKSFFPFLQRAGKIDALVEFVASGSRMRLYIPRETHLVTFLLAGISCPRPTRPAPGGAGGTIPGEPFGADALEFTKLQVLQREIQIQVESMDKGGNYIGWLHVDDKNLSVLLVESGLSSVHFTAESSAYYHQLSTFEEMAKQKKLGIWANFVEPSKEEKVLPTIIERTEDYKLMRISEVSRDGHLFGQYCSEGTSLENMMERLRQEFDARPPVGGAYKPRKGEVCAAKFVDNCWYRAKIEKMSGGQVSIFYIDYGNREITNNTRMAVLPPEFGVNSLPAFAHEIRLACTKFSKDEDYMEDAILRLSQDLIDQEVKVNREYRDAGVSFSSVIKTSDKADVAKSLLSEGLLMLSERKEKYLQKLVSEYRTAQDEAKKQHLNIWRYGDATEDDAFEFGMER